MKRIIRTTALCALLVAAAELAQGQVKIGDNPTVINKASILELESNTKGLLFPRVNLTNTTTWSLASGSTPVAGMMVYNIKTIASGFSGTSAYPAIAGDGTGIYYWDGNGWVAAKGLNGADGKSVTGAAGAPGASTPGNEGDTYINTITGDTYIKQGNTWVLNGNIKGAKGDPGTVGVQGMAGTSGTPGTPGSGTPGAPSAGVTIVTNDSGTWVYNPTTNTWTSINGPKGDKGDKGDAGVVGVQGLPGTSGTPGTPGSGTPGAPGAGVTIVTNDSGTWVYNPATDTWTNINGPKGDKGDKGDAGVVGIQGLPGTSGTPGTPGSGTPGAPGAGVTIVTNDSGTWVYNPATNTWTNINGPKGDKGDAGVVGVQGLPGTSGTPGTPGSGTPGAPGAGITIVTNDSGIWVYNPATNTWTNINGPKGDKGDKGDAGVVGVQGLPGTSGTPGIPGSGTPGAPGAGITIVTNDSGTWVYNPTTNTWTNINGPKGDKGDAGIQGMTGGGAPGTPGTPGGPGAGVTVVTNDSGTWVYNTTTNTWDNIKGDKGDKGDAGVVGVQGMTGSGTPGTPGTPGGPGAGITIVTNDSGTWVYNPTTNTWTNINGPKGDKGDAGIQGMTGGGAPGTPGTPGGPGAGVTVVTNDSGTWVYNTTTNTWDNIKGDKGDKGDAGVVGVQGMTGSGTPGIPGTPGGPGAGITIVTNDSGTWVYNPTTNTWTNINGPKGDTGTFVATVDNGLEFSTPTNIQLGGTLKKPTTITTDATQTLAIAGLQNGASTDKLVVTDASGILKSVDQSTLTVEPWNVENTTNKATSNNQNIYQNGKLGIGDFTAAKPLTQLDVRGAGTMRIGQPHPDELGGTSAIGDYSVATGVLNKVPGGVSTSFGQQNTVTGDVSMVWGEGNTSSQYLTTTFGANNTNSGVGGTMFGNNNRAAAEYQLVFGRYNAITGGSYGSFVPTDAVFQLGNGNNSTRSNAFTVLNNAHTGIGIVGTETAAKPTELLDLGGTATANNGGLKIRNINSTAYTGNINTDKLVVADATGVLKTIPMLSPNNIYNANGTLTAKRTVTMGDKQLAFVGDHQETTMSVYSGLLQEGRTSSPYGQGSIAIYGADKNANGARTALSLQAFADGNAQIYAYEEASSLNIGTHGTKVAAPISFVTSAGSDALGTEKMRITGAGNVGIATDAPSEKLDVADGNLRVRNINTNLGASSDKIVVADANGVLKTVATVTAAPQFFYSPSLVLPTSNTNLPSYVTYSAGTFTVNLHGVYASQFGMTNATGPTRSAIKSTSATTLPVLGAAALEYFVTYFDNTVFDPASIALSDAGVLTYQVLGTATVTEKTYMNIVFKVK